MAASDAQQLASDLSDLASYSSDILNDPNIALTASQTTQLNDFNTELTTASNAIATNVALNALQAAQGDLDLMKAATSQANAKAAALKADATKLNTVLSILGSAVSFGASVLSGGSLANVLTAATSLKTASALDVLFAPRTIRLFWAEPAVFLSFLGSDENFATSS